MTASHIAKNIADVGWNKIVQYTTYRAENAGTMVVLVDPGYTSQKCSNCENIKRRGMERRKESMYVGRDTPDVTPVEIRSIPERANPAVETGSPLR
jgi:hypothetical protein